MLPMAGMISGRSLYRARRARLPVRLIPLAVFGGLADGPRLAFAASPTEGSRGPSPVPLQGMVQKGARGDCART